MSSIDEALEKAAALIGQQVHDSERRKADAMSVEAEVRLRDEASYPERLRAARHHDVLCLVLKELMRGNSPWPDNKRVSNFIEAVQMAEYAADLAYPPPKAEP